MQEVIIKWTWFTMWGYGWCEPHEYKYLETHNEVDKQPKKVEIKFVIDKPWPRDNLVSTNQRYWKLNLDPLIIENQEPEVFEDTTKSVIPW